MFSCFHKNYSFIFILFLLFSLLNFDSITHFYIFVLYSVFGKHKLGGSNIDRIGKTAFTAEFLIVVNTLSIQETSDPQVFMGMRTNY